MAIPDVVQATGMIPGAYERNTLTHRQAGAMAGAPFGSADVLADASSLDAATISDREMEGGGGASQRPRRQAAKRT